MTKRKKSSRKQAAKNPAIQKKSKQPSYSLLGWLAFVFGFLLYIQTVSYDYVLDDYSVIKDNFITQQGWPAVGKMFTTHYRDGYWQKKGTLYRPLSKAMFAAEWGTAPDTPGLSHFINILLYALTGLVLFLCLRQILFKYNILLPFLGTLLFLAHPAHVEVVANIKSRDEILAFLFGFLALHFLFKYLKNNDIKLIAASLGIYFLGLLSKESAIVFLAVFPLAIYFFSNKNLIENIKLSALYLIPGLLFIGIRASVLGSVKGLEAVSHIDNMLAAAPDTMTYYASAFVLLGKYLFTLFVPVSLAADFGYNQIPLATFGNWQAILSLLIHLGLLGYALYQLKNKNILSFCILFYIITMALSSNLFVTIGTSYGERLLYMPVLAFSLGLVYLILKYTKTNLTSTPLPLKELWNQNKTPILILGIIILLFSARTILRNPAWTNNRTLYFTDIHTSPNSAKMNYYHGLELVKEALDEKDQTLKRQGYEKAITAFNRCIEIVPQYQDAFGQLGLAYFRIGDMDNALKNYEKALAYDSKDATVYSNMGIIYFNKKNIQKAQEVYQKAVELDPRFVDAWRNLGTTYAVTKQHDKAVECFREGLKYAPNSATLNHYIAMSLRDGGRSDEAKPYFDKAFALDPSLKK